MRTFNTLCALHLHFPTCGAITHTHLECCASHICLHRLRAWRVGLFITSRHTLRDVLRYFSNAGFFFLCPKLFSEPGKPFFRGRHFSNMATGGPMRAPRSVLRSRSLQSVLGTFLAPLDRCLRPMRAIHMKSLCFFSVNLFTLTNGSAYVLDSHPLPPTTTYIHNGLV